MRIGGYVLAAGGTAALGLLCAAPTLADVRSGVDAWGRGDFAAAVKEWEGPAQAGDADALFNLGQAYRLGRGVPQDTERAEMLYARAAAAGHLQAADTYGLMLFQSGRRDAALPFVQDAARRGDPRSQYLLGIAHFNGDQIDRDWVRAYALVTLANGAGLPQAARAVSEMDKFIPLAQRQQAAALAVEMRREADATRGRELAAAELSAAEPAGVAPAAPAPVVAAASNAVPRRIPTTTVPPSVSASRGALQDAMAATGEESPAQAGAAFAGGASVAFAVDTPPAPPPPSPNAAEMAAANNASVAPPPSAAPSIAADGGPWRVQLGAFSVQGNAERLWSRLSSRPELSGAQRTLVPRGSLTLLMASGYASRTAADSACGALKRAGHDCLVTRN